MGDRGFTGNKTFFHYFCYLPCWWVCTVNVNVVTTENVNGVTVCTEDLNGVTVCAGDLNGVTVCAGLTTLHFPIFRASEVLRGGGSGDKTDTPLLAFDIPCFLY